MFSIRWLLLIFFSLVATSAPARQVLDEGQPAIRMDGNRLFMKFHGEVLGPEGNPAKGFQVAARIVDSIPVTVEGNRFELEAELKNGEHGRNLKILVKSNDGKLMAACSISSFALRLAAIEGIRLRLEDVKTYQVKVVDQSGPVAAAQVVLQTANNQFLDRTDTNGECQISIPKSSTLSELSAWTSDFRAGGFSLRRGPNRDPEARIQTIELTQCRSQKIRVLDEDDKIVPGLSIEPRINTGSPFYNFLPPKPGQEPLVTDENGEAVDTWFPNWENYLYVVNIETEPWTSTSPGGFQDDTYVVRVKKTLKLDRKTMKGKLRISSKMQGGFLIQMGSFQHPQEGRFDPIYTRTDDKGYFSAEVMPDSAYQVFLVDPKWISNSWSGVLVDSESGELNEAKLKISRGPLIEVRVTGGEDRKPLPNVQVVFSSRESFEWMEDGQIESGSLGQSKWVKTNEEGIAAARAPVGRLDVRISDVDWNPSLSTKVESGVVTKLEFHRKFPGRNDVQGNLTCRDQPDVEFSNAKVFLAAMDGEYRVNLFTESDVDGKFNFSAAGGAFGIFAMLADGSAAGFSMIGSPNEAAEIELEPTLQFRGKLVDAEQNPLAGTQLTMTTAIYDPTDQNNDGQVGNIRAHLEEVTTDSEGNFEFRKVPRDLKVEFRAVTESNPRGKRLESLTLDGSEKLKRRKAVFVLR